MEKRRLKLEIELVPKSLWRINVRTALPKPLWDEIKRLSRIAAGNKCEIPGCGKSGYDQGFNWTTETHELWEYDDVKHTQTLTGFIALCPYCHKCKHWGRTMQAEDQKIRAKVLRHMQAINQISSVDLEIYLMKKFKEWRNRSNHEWTNNLDYAYEYINENKAKPAPKPAKGPAGGFDPWEDYRKESDPNKDSK